MTEAQKRLRELRERQSKDRQRMAELSREESLSDETRSELDRIENATPDLERQIRAATLALESEEREAEERGRKGVTPEVDDETRERVELRGRCKLTNYLRMAVGGRWDGAEREYNQAAGVGDFAIPIDLMDGDGTEERDAATGTPASGTGVNLDPIRPRIYARSVLPRLGVEMPRVPSGTFSTATIATGLTAGPRAAGAAHESTAATFTPSSTTPHSISARLSLRIEDVASIGADNFESALRQNLMLALSDSLDAQGLTGDGSGNNLSGLLQGLTDPTDPTDLSTFTKFAEIMGAGLDGGPWAESLSDLSILVGVETMILSIKTFQSATNFIGDLSAHAYAKQMLGDWFCSSRMPAAASDVQQAIIHRRGGMGMALDGVAAMRTAVCPVWDEIGIDDIYTDSKSGLRHYTLHSLVGDVLVTQPGAYVQTAYKLA